jgi:hypothetical protein
VRTTWATQRCWAEFRVTPASPPGRISSTDVVKNIIGARVLAFHYCNRARTEGRCPERPATCTKQHTRGSTRSMIAAAGRRAASAWTCVLDAAFSEPTCTRPGQQGRSARELDAGVVLGRQKRRDCPGGKKGAGRRSRNETPTNATHPKQLSTRGVGSEFTSSSYTCPQELVCSARLFAVFPLTRR